MKALTVIPLTPNSAELSEVDEPPASDGPVLVETIAVGICGTDIEILSGAYGWAPPQRERLTLGHESLGRVLQAPPDSHVAKGDLVVGIVRRPDPVPCMNCAVGEWDFCRNGQYTERGIKSHDGYLSERYRITPDFLVKVDAGLGLSGVLLEPTSVVAKAWEQVNKIGGRAHWQPSKALITGAGPIGLLAALLSVQQGIETYVIDQVTSGIKPDLVTALGAHYHTGSIEKTCPDADVIIECTGVPSLVFDAIEHIGPGGVVCLTGVSSGGRAIDVDAGSLNRSMVLENESVVGSVNANRRHYEEAAAALANADPKWLRQLITRTVPISRWQEALDRKKDDVKVVIEVSTI
ncbi:MAG: glucose 1-dehydrogenase [Actinobacteria bacterium]|nr:glucose 1-dehydrogenase [Actinomycetota bacterium]